MRTKLLNTLIARIILLILITEPCINAIGNNEALQACLDKADQTLLVEFRVLCLNDDKINGGTEEGKNICRTASAEEAIGFMTVSAYNRDVFDRILNQRTRDRADCFNLYR